MPDLKVLIRATTPDTGVVDKRERTVPCIQPSVPGDCHYDIQIKVIRPCVHHCTGEAISGSDLAGMMWDSVCEAVGGGKRYACPVQNRHSIYWDTYYRWQGLLGKAGVSSFNEPHTSAKLHYPTPGDRVCEVLVKLSRDDGVPLCDLWFPVQLPSFLGNFRATVTVELPCDLLAYVANWSLAGEVGAVTVKALEQPGCRVAEADSGALEGVIRAEWGKWAKHARGWPESKLDVQFEVW